MLLQELHHACATCDKPTWEVWQNHELEHSRYNVLEKKSNNKLNKIELAKMRGKKSIMILTHIIALLLINLSRKKYLTTINKHFTTFQMQSISSFMNWPPRTIVRKCPIASMQQLPCQLDITQTTCNSNCYITFYHNRFIFKSLNATTDPLWSCLNNHIYEKYRENIYLRKS